MESLVIPVYETPRIFAVVNWFMDFYESVNDGKDWTGHGFACSWFILVDDKSNKKLIAHEQKHVEQMKRFGYISYLQIYKEQYNTYGYWKMPLEVEARRAEENV